MRTLKKALTKINFTPENGLVFCNKPEEAKHISEQYHIQDKAKKLKVTAVLFRRKYENDKITDSKPVLYIYNEIDEFHINSEKYIDLHAKIWSAGDVDIYFIVSKTTIHIFNARKSAEVEDQDNQKLNLSNLLLVRETLNKFNDQRFSAIVFGKGTFWEQEDFYNRNNKPFFDNKLEEGNTPFHRLLEYLMAVRKHLHTDQNNLSKEVIDKLLIICILIKFLGGKKDDNGKHTLRKIYKEHNVESFAEALENGLCIPILQKLANEFNGNIFDNFSDKEKRQIEQTDLKSVADFLKATLDPIKNQYFLWEQYSFNYLPVELISAIYERFLPKEKGVVYTPPFLVNFLIDEKMPLDKVQTYFSQEQFKVLDPSCGSGVFLVAAYKRMLQWWSVKHYKKTRKIVFPDKKVCQRILEKNIYGVDINDTAMLISIFSLTIALLDKLEPKEIWNNLKLNSLRDNIQTRDFFKWTAENKDKIFDLVIGNPPFNPMSGKSKKDAVTESQIQQFDIRNKDIPNNNFALKFFEGAMSFGKKTCLILPSNVLLYNKSKVAQKYRNHIFTDFTIEKIFDFTHLRRELFGSVDTPVCAVFANSTKSKGQKIEHTVIKRISSIEKKIFFEIDHYDRHFVCHDWATDEKKQFVWKTNLLGGGRLFHLIYRLSLLENLKQFIKNRKKENKEWIFQEGYKDGSEFPIPSKRKKSCLENPVSYIYNQDKVSFIKGGEIISNEKESLKYFDRPRPENLYKLPLIIIHKKIGSNYLPVGIKEIHEKNYLVFTSSFVGIHAPEKDFNKLNIIYNNLKKYSKHYQLWILATSPSSMIGQETAIKKTDLDTLPFPENKEYLELSKTEKILQEDVLEYSVHLGKAISERGKGRILQKKVSQEQLKIFGKNICNVLNPIYAKNGKSWQCGKSYQTQSFTICQLGYGKNKGLSFQVLDELDDIIKSLIYNDKSHRGAIFTRVCRIYKHVKGYDCVFLIKPHAIRYWLNSIALRDADETFIELKKAGR